MKSILVSRPSFFVLVLMLVVGLAACERPLEEEEGAESDSIPATKAANGGNETLVETPAASEEVFLPNIETEAGDGGEVEASPEESGVVPEAAVEAAGPAAHVIQEGDSLFIVAQQYNISLDDLAATNNLDANALLSPGATLIIPGGAASAGSVLEAAVGNGDERIHIVQSGENLYRIGLVYGVTIEALAAYNALENPDVLDVGQEIRIPPEGTP